MSGVAPLLASHDLVPPLNDDEAELVAKELAADTGMAVYSRSIASRDGRVYFLAHKDNAKALCLMSNAGDADEFEGDLSDCAHGKVKVCPMSHANAEAIRKALPFTAPIVVGRRVSLGLGDRLGLATPGHIRAVRGTGVVPVLCQQSIREMTRTQRTPEDVMDAATWGVMEEGYRDGFGADADHLKVEADIDCTWAVGFRMFTIDPGDHVDNAAGRDGMEVLADKLKGVPWDDLETTEDACRQSFTGQTFQIGHEMVLAFDEETFRRAVVKYGRAVAHVKKLFRYLVAKADGREFELEMSVDETDSPTSVHEHFYVAHELKRLGVDFVSLAPRFIGEFEKGIDYKGDLAAFEEAFVQHAQIARYFGPYKISIHSGSDKFSVYPIAANHAGDMVHVKTAGTSYLEALRCIARVAPSLFREILAFARGRYDVDRATYHVSAEVANVPAPDALADDALARVLDTNDGREVLHVTFGSVLTTLDNAGKPVFRDRLLAALRNNEETHYEILCAHLGKHVAPFAKS